MEWNFDAIKEKVGELVEKYVDGFEIENSKFEAILPEIPSIVEKVSAKLEDGFQWTDLIVIGGIIPDAMKIVDKFPDLTNEEKHELVLDAVWIVYKTIDKYPDNANNINIPLVFGVIEEKLEYAITRLAAGMAIKAVYPAYKEAKEADETTADETK